MNRRRSRLRLVAMSAAGRGSAAPDDDELALAYVAFWRERARRELVLDSIKASLEEQPSRAAVRSCARNWVADVLALAEDVAKSKQEPRR